MFGLREGFLGAEYLLQQGAEEGAELVVVEGEVAHRRFGLAGGTHFDDGRVGLGGSPVDAEQGGRYLERLLAAEDGGVEERLENVARTAFGRLEELGDAFGRLGRAAGLVVDNAQGVALGIHAVHRSTYAQGKRALSGIYADVFADVLLHGLHAEGGIAQVVAQQLPDVGGNDAGMYQLRAVVLCLLVFGQVEEVFLEGAVHVVADAGRVAQQLFDGVAAYLLAVGGEVGIDKLGRAVEDGTEEGGIYLGTHLVGCLEAGNVAVVELEAAIEIGVEGRGREDGTWMDTGVEGVAQASHHGLVLGYAYRACRLGRLACLDVAAFNGVGRLDQELEHEARHFAAVQPVG